MYEHEADIDLRYGRFYAHLNSGTCRLPPIRHIRCCFLPLHSATSQGRDIFIRLRADLYRDPIRLSSVYSAELLRLDGERPCVLRAVPLLTGHCHHLQCSQSPLPGKARPDTRRWCRVLSPDLYRFRRKYIANIKGYECIHVVWRVADHFVYTLYECWTLNIAIGQVGVAGLSRRTEEWVFLIDTLDRCITLISTGV